MRAAPAASAPAAGCRLGLSAGATTTAPRLDDHEGGGGGGGGGVGEEKNLHV